MDLAYTIKRSDKRRKVTITVDRDRGVTVHAPKDTSEAAIEQIVQAKRAWIYEKVNHPRKYSDLPHPPGKELVNGESILYLGRRYRVEVLGNNAESVTLDETLRVPGITPDQCRAALRAWYIAAAKSVILPRVESQSRRLGVHPTSVKIVDNRYRWGSCTVDKGVRINWRVVKAPAHVIDYVIVHELAHILEQNHTDDFWGIVRAHTASLDKSREWLRDYGQVLEEEV